MDYPIWELEFGGGRLIAIVAIVHVFVAHFAVGGGLLLVLTEHRAYRHQDVALLGWLRRHSKFFALVTLVLGAVTGVGIWFTIGLVHPSATSSLIHLFLWVWAIEWTLFFVEICAALIYAHSWERLSRRAHLIIGWIYFAAAYLSLVAINGILSFMFTPGQWLADRGLWEAFFNPSYWPSLLVRSLAAMALAGLYVFVTAWREDPELKVRLARYGAVWALPATVVGPLAAYVYFAVGGDVAWDTIKIDVPNAVLALTVISVSSLGYSALLLLVAGLAKTRPAVVSLPVGVLLLLLGLGSIGGGEYIREGVRKPFVIGNLDDGGYMYVNALRVEELSETQRSGLLSRARWLIPTPDDMSPEIMAGKNLFRVACQGCHTLSGPNPIRPRVDQMPRRAIRGAIPTLDKRVGRMPPFAGNAEEHQLLAHYLASLDGDVEPLAMPDPEAEPVDRGEALVEEHCLSCHSLQSDDDDPPALIPRIDGWSVEEAYETLGKLEEVDEEMFPFEGSEEDRRILADTLAKLAAGGDEGE